MSEFGRIRPDRSIEMDAAALAVAPIPVTIISTAVTGGGVLAEQETLLDGSVTGPGDWSTINATGARFVDFARPAGATGVDIWASCEVLGGGSGGGNVMGPGAQASAAQFAVVAQEASGAQRFLTVGIAGAGSSNAAAGLTLPTPQLLLVQGRGATNQNTANLTRSVAAAEVPAPVMRVLVYATTLNHYLINTRQIRLIARWF